MILPVGTGIEQSSDCIIAEACLIYVRKRKVEEYVKKVLYLTNIETPYRVRFFNELAKFCDLTVLYETQGTEDRDQIWAKSVKMQHRAKFLRRRSVLFSGIMKEICSGYDSIIVGCYNSPVQMMAMILMRLLRIPFIINLDGEPFIEGNSLKNRIKRIFLSGAEKYLVAGEKAAQSLAPVAGNKTVIPYYFSSLSEQELQERCRVSKCCKRNNTILVVAQYLHVKGLDVVLETARMDQSLYYKLVGMGKRTELFVRENDIPPNVEVIPFLQKEELEKEYLSCAMLVLPSRQECWGLVINEAASFGMPIVSTWGSGAALEFLADEYPHNLAQPGNAESLYKCIRECVKSMHLGDYSNYLLTKSRNYSIEKSAYLHACALK